MSSGCGRVGIEVTAGGASVGVAGVLADRVEVSAVGACGDHVTASQRVPGDRLGEPGGLRDLLDEVVDTETG